MNKFEHIWESGAGGTYAVRYHVQGAVTWRGHLYSEVACPGGAGWGSPCVLGGPCMVRSSALWLMVTRDLPIDRQIERHD